MRRALVGVVALLTVSGCGTQHGGQGPTGSSAAVAARSPTGATGSTATAALCDPGSHALPARSGGLLHVPAGASGRRPLLLAFHGAGGTAKPTEAYYGLDRLADRDGFLVAYPQAAHDRFWELRPDQRTDVADTRALIGALTALPCVDADRVTATGVSNGGGFTARVGCELSDVVAGVAPVAGGYRALGPCPVTRPVDVLELHGTADQVVPYGGRPPDHAGSVGRFVAGWVARDGCEPRAARSEPRHGVLRLDYAGCRGGVRVEHLRLAGTDHGWPGGDSRAAGFPHPFPEHDPTGLDAAATVWAFLRTAHR